MNSYTRLINMISEKYLPHIETKSIEARAKDVTEKLEDMKVASAMYTQHLEALQAELNRRKGGK